MFVFKQGRYRGYKKEILSEALNEFTNRIISCLVCDGVMREPCGYGNPLIITCNVCCEGEQSVLLAHISQPILALDVLCPTTLRMERDDRHCRWEGQLAQVQEHLATCEMFRENCDLNCGLVMEVCMLPVHRESQCKMRQVECQYCQCNFLFKDTDTHYANCHFYPIECTNDGCQQIMARRDFTDHVGVCDFTEVVCDYVAYGCDHKMLRKDREEHNATHSLNHMRLEMKQMENQIRNLRAGSTRSSELAGYTLSLIWNLVINVTQQTNGPSFRVPPSSTIFYPKYIITAGVLHIALFFKKSGKSSFKFWAFVINQIDRSFCIFNKRTNLELQGSRGISLFADIRQHVIAQFDLAHLREQGVIVDNTLSLQIYSLETPTNVDIT